MRLRLWANRGIRLKVFTLSLAVGLVPILAVNTLWSVSAHDQLRQAAKKNQEILLDGSASRLDRFFARKTNALTKYAQDLSAANFSTIQKQQSLLQYAKHDEDIVSIALVDKAGNEQIVVDDQALVQRLGSVNTNTISEAAANAGNKVSIDEVIYVDNQPRVAFTVPITAQNVSGTQAENSSTISGFLIVDVDLRDMWRTVLNAPLGEEGYTYIVDAKGRLIAHPDTEFFRYHLDLSKNQQVAEFLRNPNAEAINITTISERNVKVMSGYKAVPRTGWAIITEEPEVSLYAPVQHVYRVILWVFIASTLAAALLSFFFSRNLTRPIKSLVTGASELGEGNLDTRIRLQSKDEIGALAQKFNKMADNLNDLISNLKAESTKLNVVLDSVNEGIVAVDAENRIVVANASAAILAGVLPANLNGKQFRNVFRLTKNSRPFHVDLQNTQVYKEIIFISPNKRLHYLDIYTNKIEDDPDGIRSIITIRDQTDERDLEKMKHDFVSMAAHELRTPITAIRGYLDLLAADKASNLSDRSDHYIQSARSSTEDLVGLINNLLNVSKIENGTLDMAYGKIDWASTLKSAIGNHRFSAAEKDITLEYEGPEKGVVLVADEIAIKEVINNLIANALHYTNQGGHVTVSMQVEQDKVVTSVKDTGMGIPPNAMRRLFTKFYRVKGGMASGSGGTGLGLFISKSIVELHKGKIWVESEEGKGSTFTFTLPVYDEVQYKILVRNQNEGYKKRRGWITKNTAR